MNDTESVCGSDIIGWRVFMKKKLIFLIALVACANIFLAGCDIVVVSPGEGGTEVVHNPATGQTTVRDSVR